MKMQNCNKYMKRDHSSLK